MFRHCSPRNRITRDTELNACQMPSQLRTGLKSKPPLWRGGSHRTFRGLLESRNSSGAADQAVKWFKLSAAQGHADAQFYLGSKRKDSRMLCLFHFVVTAWVTAWRISFQHSGSLCRLAGARIRLGQSAN